MAQVEKLISPESKLMKKTTGVHTSSGVTRFRTVSNLLVIALFGGLFGMLMSCGDGGSGNTTLPPTPTTTIQVNMGDAPADWVLSFTTTINSVSLNRSIGSTNMSANAPAIELMQLMGTMQPVALVPIPQGSYTGATVTFGNCNVTYIDPSTGAITQTTLQGPFSTTVNFDSPVTLGTTPLVFNFDLDLNNSLTANTNNNLAFSPKFHFALGTQGQGNQNDPANGGMQQMMGAVNSFSNGVMTMTALQAAQTFTIKTNTATQYQGIATNPGMMNAGMGVLVNATLQSDGSLLATQIASRTQSGGAMGGGIITEATGTPATQLTLVMQNGAGAGMMSNYFSKTVTVDLTSTTQYEVNDEGVDLNSLPFTPFFDASNIYPGQSVIPVSESSGMMAGSGMMGSSSATITASSVYLREQGFRGTTDVAITPGASGTFTLTLLADCAFSKLTGATSLLIYQQTGTNVMNETEIAAGATLRIHGLLLKNAGQWTVIASTIATY